MNAVLSGSSRNKGRLSDASSADLAMRCWNLVMGYSDRVTSSSSSTICAVRNLRSLCAIHGLQGDPANRLLYALSEGSVACALSEGSVACAL